jgi:hypothetical protein
MPRLQLTHSTVHEIALRQRTHLAIRTEDDHSQTIFADAEKLLRKRHFQRGLKALPQHGAGDHSSILDWLFCQLHPEFDLACKAYYSERGPRLAEDPRATPELIALWDKQLCILLDAAAAAAENDEALEWVFARLLVNHPTVRSTARN